MEFFCILILAFLVFKGNVIQIQAYDEIESTPIIEVSPNQPDLSNDLIEVILSKAGFKTTKMAGQSRALMTISGDAMRRIFQDRIIVIDPNRYYDGTYEYYNKGERYLEIANYARLLSLFQQFGGNTSRIHVYYGSMNDSVRSEINKNIIKKCANQLTELKISTSDDTRIWEELSNENGSIFFPEVKKFKYLGPISRNSFDLNSIFPKLETFTLLGSVNDTNCLKNVKSLKELTMSTSSIEEHQFDNIFANNKQIYKLSLATITRKTLGAIEKNLNNLKTLKVKYVCREFFIRPTNETNIYNLESIL
ncbi:uncharacterized protein LOC116338176 [Contarinia nasturtii]|uniref:uncharacterized protein LOC116338176 n=1 Tax=Contarinia nasturtii TaxID=265458 RepID=UPI0012D47067|nr:uncharacterized protein LOC116338176 [Contarinia nasturtii]